MMIQRLVSITLCSFLCLRGYNQWKSLPPELFYKYKNSKFITAQKDSFLVKDNPDFELYHVAVRLDSFFYNSRTAHFRIKGKTTLNNSRAGVPIEICKKNGKYIHNLKIPGKSTDFTDDELQAGMFDVTFKLAPKESIIFYLGGAIHEEF